MAFGLVGPHVALAFPCILGLSFILAFVGSGFGCLTWVLGLWVFFWEGCSGFLLGFGGLLGCGAFGADLGV
jgi:hypothetical protein